MQLPDRERLIKELADEMIKADASWILGDIYLVVDCNSKEICVTPYQSLYKSKSFLLYEAEEKEDKTLDEYLSALNYTKKEYIEVLKKDLEPSEITEESIYDNAKMDYEDIMEDKLRKDLKENHYDEYYIRATKIIEGWEEGHRYTLQQYYKEKE